MAAEPTADLAARIARIEADLQIRQLAVRYALAVDTKNLDDLVALFTEDVRVGRSESGRPALKAWFGDVLAKFSVSIHQVMNHIITIEDEDHATGVVYCRDELEQGGDWLVGVIQYWDDYERCDGRWLFKRRRLHRWYIVPATEKPGHGAAVGDHKNQPVLPDAWPSWQAFWDTRAGK